MRNFSEITNNCKKLRNCFDGNLPQSDAFDKFSKSLNNTFHLAFKKIRIRSSNQTTQARVGSIEKKLLEKTDMEKLLKSSQSEDDIKVAKRKLDLLDLEIYEILAEKNAKIVQEQVGCLDSLDGSFNQIGMWKIKKKLCPRPKDPPTAKKDVFGNLITAPSALKNLYLQTYKNRLENRPIVEKYKGIRDLKNELWELRFEYLKEKPTASWTLEDLERATKTLKNNQSRDPNGMISELFKPKIAGKDLKKAILDLMNMILSTFEIP